MQTHTTLKSPEKTDRGTGTTRPGTGTASNRHHKAKPRHAQKQKAQKTHPDNPTKKGGTQPRPGPSTHAHTTQPSQKRQGTSGARTQTRTPRTATRTRRCRRPRGTGRRAHTHPNTPPRRGGAQPKPKPQHTLPHRTLEPEKSGGQVERARNYKRLISRPKPKPNHEHHKQLAKKGQHHKPCPNTPTQDLSQDWRG